MYFFVKRIFDVFLSIALIFFLSPLFFAVISISFFKFNRQFLFLQSRAGINGKPFTIIKFRSMTSEVDHFGALLPDRYRVTPYGRFLRSSSIDELPALFNVIRGDMSFVGPRPLLTSYTPLYSRFQRSRLTVKPGITGLAQVLGRNSITWRQRFRLDFLYVKKQSFLLDLLIILLTIWKVLWRHDVNHSSSVTMPAFTGK